MSTTVVTVTSYSTPVPEPTNPGTGAVSATPAPASNQSWIEGHWRWILMVCILAVGFALLTGLAIWLKRRHRRKVEKQRAAVSGFPTATEKKDGARSATPDLWGPHQHMHHTRGWEYNQDPAIMGSGALVVTSDRRGSRRSKKASSSQRKHRYRNEMAELDARRAPSRYQSSKGKSRAPDEAVRLDPEMGPADRCRSRSQTRRDPERDLERNSQSEHQRRLREVRGSRRKKNMDQS
ncbi:uncharacterized protein Z518_02191 [Rhinocladiella mackenziei CBS 650.93]|uniref:Uncharacterized protein n=1 Tax=Rhinocladiella mackenziei CBS 650.93 TaxID=1442369 RepID=A0A0D2HAT3_9EURO|nr:uncharacterized protein Z518_02191 [Rhinocladiella mackenziei CBS 650.93]KIX07538.1 hypothetical protein Z518_02191 [Rhinocladiella mackenziei CBS 650.93]